MSHEAIFDERGIADDLLAVFREGRPPIVRGITDVLMGRRRGVERLLSRFADVCKLDNRPIRLDVAHYAELIMREVGQ